MPSLISLKQIRQDELIAFINTYATGNGGFNVSGLNAYLASGDYTLNNTVRTTGDQDISGVKTFKDTVIFFDENNEIEALTFSLSSGLLTFGAEGQVSINSYGRSLSDTQGSQSIDWEGRVLKDGFQNYSVQWGDRVLRNAGQDYVLDWNNSTLLGNWALGSGTGVFLTTDKTGLFYFASNPSGFITGINTGQFVTVDKTGSILTAANSYTNQYTGYLASGDPLFLYAAMDVNNENNGLLIASSQDGIKFDISQGAVLYTPDYPTRHQLRDPSIIKLSGDYYVAHTTNAFVQNEDHFSILKSPDLIHWTEIARPSMASITGTTATYAPEFFRDTDGSVNVVVSVAGTGFQHTFYALKASGNNLSGWGAPVRLTGPAFPTSSGNNGYDASVYIKDGVYNMAWKDVTRGNTIINATGTSLTGGWVVNKSGNWFNHQNVDIEGPSVVDMGNGVWRIYYVFIGPPTNIWYTESRDNMTSWSSPVMIDSGLTPLNHGTCLYVRDYDTVKDINWAMGLHRNTPVASPKKAFANSDVYVGQCDGYIALTGSLTTARNVYLPVASGYPTDQPLWIVDEGGSVSSTNTLTIQRNTNDKINGLNTYVLNYPRASVVLRSDGVTGWYVNSNFINTGLYVATGTTGNFASVTNLAVTGSNLQAQINSLTGSLNVTGLNLQNQINSLTGSLNNTGSSLLAQINSLTGSLNGTGSNLQAQINSLTGSLNNTGSNLQAQINSLSGSAIRVWTLKTGLYTGFAGDKILADTTTTGFSIYLPSGTITGAEFRILDPQKTWSGNYLVVNGNGSNIESYNTPLTGNIAGDYMTFVYVGGNQGWRLLPL